MWTAGKQEALSVWADELQSHGDAWGELVATSIAAGLETDPMVAARLAQRVGELETDVMFPRVHASFEGQPGIVPTWEHGVLVGLRVCDPRGAAIGSTLERIGELLRLPAARFLWLLHIDLSPSTELSAHLHILRLVLDPEVEARPRVIMLGTPPRHSGRRERVALVSPRVVTLLMPSRSDREFATALVEPTRELCSLFFQSARVELPWAKGDGGSRMQTFERLAARIRAQPTHRWTRDHTLLARALWDGSMRVQMAALDCVVELGTDAAVFVPELALVDRGQPAWRDRVRQVLAELAAQPEVVRRVATSFVAEQVAVLRWLASAGAIDDAARDRIRGMLRHGDGLPGWIVRELRDHAGGLSTPPTPTWLERLDAWRTRALS